MERALRELPTAALSSAQVEELRALLVAAFADDEHGGFDEADWQHALGGTHVIAEVGGRIVAHAALVERPIEIGERTLRTGYVEAVATLPHEQRRGHGSAVMRRINELIESGFELGALGTGSQPFYERLGWQVWCGPSHVRTAAGALATPDEDGYIMVLPTARTPRLGATAPISCDWRPGDVW